MGYSHYWNRPRIIAPAVFDRIVHDLSCLQPVWKQRGIPLAGPLGTGRPRFDRQEIAFNGRIRCRHPQSDIGSPLSRLLTVAALMSMPGEAREAACARLWEEEHAQRRCPGSCVFETFWFPRVARQVTADADGRYWDRTKTAFRPYDLAVTSALLVVRRHLGAALRIDSDGGQAQWWDARLICQSVLGYGFKLSLGLRDE